jgi:hypothetical protein
MMILVKNHKDYNQDFPEKFIWEIIDSYKLSELSASIAAEVEIFLNKNELNYVPGLRMALNMISEVAEYYEVRHG